MANGVLDSPELTQARQASEAATRQAGETAATAITMPDLLRQAVTERFKESPLHGQFESAAQQFLTAVPEKRASLAETVTGGGPILSPTQQQSILAGTRAANLVPLISLNDLLQSQFGGMETMIGAGTRAYQAVGARQQMAAELARQQYQDILNELVTAEQLRRSGTGGGFNLSDLFGLGLGAGTGAGDGFVPDAPGIPTPYIPTYDPTTALGMPGAGGGGLFGTQLGAKLGQLLGLTPSPTTQPAVPISEQARGPTAGSILGGAAQGLYGLGKKIINPFTGLFGINPER